MKGMTLAGAKHNKATLVDKMKTEATLFATTFLSNTKKRFDPYWSILCAFELVDPTSNKSDVEKSLGSENVWEAMEGMVKNCNTKLRGADLIDFETLRDQLGNWQDQRFDAYEKADIRHNLLRFFHKTRREARFSEVYKFAAQVFTKPIASVIIESLFSKMAYIRSKYRASMDDSNVFNCIAVKDLDPVHAHPEKKFEMPRLNMLKALQHNLKWDTYT